MHGERISPAYQPISNYSTFIFVSPSSLSYDCFGVARVGFYSGMFILTLG